MFHKRKLEYPAWDWKPEAEQKLWTKADDGSAELELHWLLYSLVSILKPEVVFESGTCHGYSTYWLGKAVGDNGRGWVYTAEVNREYLEEAMERCKDIPRIRFLNNRASDCQSLRDADFFFCDSNYGDRADELSLLKPGAVALVHDTNAYALQWANGAKPISHAVEGFSEHIFFRHTLRGFALLRKK
jgi:hypothetical protein